MAFPLLGLLAAGFGAAGLANAGQAQGYKMTNPDGAEGFEGFDRLAPDRQSRLQALDQMARGGLIGRQGMAKGVNSVFENQAGFADDVSLQTQRDQAAMARTQATAGAAMARQIQAQKHNEMLRQAQLEESQTQFNNAIEYANANGAGFNEFTPASVVQQSLDALGAQTAAEIAPGPTQAPQGYNAEQIGYQNRVDNARYAIDAVDAAVEFAATTFGPGQEAVQRSQRTRIGNNLQLRAMAPVMEALNTGVLNSPSEERRIMGILGQPGGWMDFVTSTDANDIAALDALRRYLVDSGNQNFGNLNMSLGNFGPINQPLSHKMLTADDVPKPEPVATGGNSGDTIGSGDRRDNRATPGTFDWPNIFGGTGGGNG